MWFRNYKNVIKCSTYDTSLHKSYKYLLSVKRIVNLEAEVNKIINHFCPSTCMLHELYEKKDIHVNMRGSFRAVNSKVIISFQSLRIQYHFRDTNLSLFM